MKLYKLDEGILKGIHINPFKREKEIQGLVESNVSSLFNLEFIKNRIIFRKIPIGYTLF